ncbi:hypothetical protein TrVE_jg12567 [Triparma verrucosa]|uniref:Dethiobiotin synthase n=1 Tax=Triparma verrucosa TaxID=1606542 RepID=A0A9W7FJK4_9STRA|nr:hypothetical protein TrVE_jg12567 [Triparma verrucosa]
MSASRAHLIFSSNTNVGKTLLSAGLCRYRTHHLGLPTTYLKPLQCGVPWDEDLIKLYSNPKHLHSKTLASFDPYPCSPHLASILSGQDTNTYKTDSETLTDLKSSISSTPNHQTYIETAGGVYSPPLAFPSPSPSPPPPPNYVTYKSTSLIYTLQSHTYSSLNLPTILVGDSKLGGLSTTLTSLESLINSNHVIEYIVFIGSDKSYDLVSNAETVSEYIKMKGLDVKVIELPSPPELYDNKVEGDLWEYFDSENFISQISKIK